jgi:hypothetical protein
MKFLIIKNLKSFLKSEVLAENWRGVKNKLSFFLNNFAYFENSFEKIVKISDILKYWIDSKILLLLLKALQSRDRPQFDWGSRRL